VSAVSVRSSFSDLKRATESAILFRYVKLSLTVTAAHKLICDVLEVDMRLPEVGSFIRLPRALWLNLLVVVLVGLIESEAATQTISFGP
jgi:hypothetical protein